MSLAAGQSEALAPMIVLEIFFLHERGTKLGWFIFIECTGTGVFFIVSIYMTAAWGWRWWYAFFSITNGAILLLSFIFISETLYDRPEDATTGEVELNLSAQMYPSSAIAIPLTLTSIGIKRATWRKAAKSTKSSE